MSTNKCIGMFHLLSIVGSFPLCTTLQVICMLLVLSIAYVKLLWCLLHMIHIWLASPYYPQQLCSSACVYVYRCCVKEWLSWLHYPQFPCKFWCSQAINYFSMSHGPFVSSDSPPFSYNLLSASAMSVLILHFCCSFCCPCVRRACNMYTIPVSWIFDTIRFESF